MTQTKLSPMLYVGLEPKIKRTVRKREKDVIINTVVKFYELPRELVLSKSRLSHLVECRMVIAYVLKKCTPMNWTEIGRALGRDHSTIIHSVNTCEDRLSVERDFRKKFKELAEALKEKGFEV